MNRKKNGSTGNSTGTPRAGRKTTDRRTAGQTPSPTGSSKQQFGQSKGSDNQQAGGATSYGATQRLATAAATTPAGGARGPKGASEAARNKSARTVFAAECVASPAITADDIRARAYEIYLARRGQPGDPVVDWLQAERELRELREMSRSAPRTQR